MYFLPARKSGLTIGKYLIKRPLTDRFCQKLPDASAKGAFIDGMRVDGFASGNPSSCE